MKNKNKIDMNNLKNITLVLLSSLVLSSCSLFKKYESPELEPITKDLYALMETSGDTASDATIPWKNFFSDKNLQSLIGEALENNTDLNVAALSVAQAELALQTARLSFLPSFNLNPSAGYSSFAGSSSKTYAISLNASWEADLFGKIRNAKFQQQALYEQTKAYKDLVQTGLVASVASSYFSLLMLDEQLRISVATKANWQENIKTMQALMKAGRINESGLLQTMASAKALDSQIVGLELQIVQMEIALSQLLSKAPSKIERGTLSAVSFPEQLSVGVPLALVSRRSDVRVAEYNLSSAFYATQIARAELYPTLSLSGTLGFTNSGGGGVSNPGDLLFSAAANLLQPIFNAKALRNQVTISKSQQEQALLEFKQTVLDAASEVNSAVAELQTVKKQVAIDLEKIELLEKSLSSTELLMKHAQVNYLDVLTAQLSLLSAELSLSSNVYAQFQATIDLYRSLGGGVE